LYSYLLMLGKTTPQFTGIFTLPRKRGSEERRTPSSFKRFMTSAK